jgi:hypothetical protein
VYQEIVKNLNSLWKVDDTDGCFARVEALLATAPRADLLTQLRDFMPASSINAWQQSAPPSDPGKGEGSAREPITFAESDDEAAAADAVDADDNSDDDVVLVSTTLTNPLVDLPHARHECASFPMPARDDADGLMLARRFCARCYCTLCDRPVSDCAAWPEHSRYRDEPPWRAVRDALVAVPEPPPRRFKRPRLRAGGAGRGAAATAVPRTVAAAALRAAATAAPRAAATAAPRAAAPAAPQARRRRPERPGAFDADDRRETAVPAAAPTSVDDATVAQRTRDLMLIDEEIRRQYRDGSLTVGTVRRAVATGLGVDEEAIKKVVNATLILGTPRRYLLDQVRAELQAEDAAPSPAARDDGNDSNAAPPPEQDGNDSDVGAYFELSDDND